MEKKFYQTHGNEYLKRQCLYNLYAIDTNVYLLVKCKLNVYKELKIKFMNTVLSISIFIYALKFKKVRGYSLYAQ